MPRAISLLGICLGLLSALSLYLFLAKEDAPPQADMPPAEVPAGHSAALPQPVPVDNEILPLDEIVEVASAEEAQALAAWWAGQNPTAVSLLQKFHAYGLTEGWRLRVMHARDGGYLVRFMDGDTIRGFARFWPDLRLWQAGGGDVQEAATAISADEVRQVTLACWRLLHVDPAVLPGMWDELPPLPAEGWTRACGNWMSETSVTDSEKVEAGGHNSSSSSGRRVFISIGDDGVLRDVSMSRWSRNSSRRSCRAFSCGHRGGSGDEADEPSPPMASN